MQTRRNYAKSTSDLREKLLDKQQFAWNTMAGVVDKCKIASVPPDCTLKKSDRCLFTSPCANVPEKMKAAFQGTCKYMVFKSAGTQTLEKCVRKLKTSTELKQFVTKALEKLMCLHSALVYHKDFQLKNLMTDSQCDPDAIQIVDVDDITKMHNRDDKNNRDAHKSALKDLLDLLGQNLEKHSLYTSSFTMKEWVSTPSTDLEDKIGGKVEEPEMNPDGIKFAETVDEKIKQKLEEVSAVIPDWDELNTFEKELKEIIENLDV